MALKVEGVVDRGMHAEEALGRSRRFEPLHLALSAPYRLMRILRAIVLPEPLLMRAGQLQLPKRRTIGAQLIGHQQFRHKPLLSEKPALAATPPGRRGGAAQACRGPRLRGRRHARGISACQRSRQHLVQVPSIARPRTALPSRRAITGPNFSTQLRDHFSRERRAPARRADPQRLGS